MRVLVIADVHANLEALDAVLADAGRFEAVVSLGDLVGYGPNPNEVVDRVRALPNVTSLLGNHDLAALGQVDLATFNPHARRAAEWTGKQLSPEAKEYLLALSPRQPWDHAFLAHASPRDPVWEYMEHGMQGPSNFRAFNGPLGLVGHTHVPRVFVDQSGLPFSSVWQPSHGETVQVNDGSRRIVNPGGVGQPRDGDPRAAYAIYETDSGTITFQRVAYPFHITQTRILTVGLPETLALRLAHGV